LVHEAFSAKRRRARFEKKERTMQNPEDFFNSIEALRELGAKAVKECAEVVEAARAEAKKAVAQAEKAKAELAEWQAKLEEGRVAHRNLENSLATLRAQRDAIARQLDSAMVEHRGAAA
jgi:methylthioribose-1-phosphate isomerase